MVAASRGPSYLTNEHLRVYNGLMQKAAEEKQVVFLDLYSEFANENGELPEEASKDRDVAEFAREGAAAVVKRLGLKHN